MLTDVIRSDRAASPNAELDALLAELQTKLAARTFKLADELLRSAFAEMEATLFEQISGKLRRATAGAHRRHAARAFRARRTRLRTP